MPENWGSTILVLCGCILFLMVYGATSADSISSSIVCSGSTWLHSTVIGPSETYTAHLFTSDNARVDRELKSGSSVSARISGTSTGAMGIDEYSGIVRNETVQDRDCLFTLPKSTLRNDKVSATGLLLHGNYNSYRILSGSMKAGEVVNGTGILLLRAGSDDGNKTLSHASDVAGEMNLTEQVILGEDDD